MVDRKVEPPKQVKRICQAIKRDFNSSFSHREKEEIRHIGELFLGGFFIGAVMLGVHFYSLSKGEKSAGIHFFDHLIGSIENGFILGGFLVTGLLLLLAGWILENAIYKFLVTPWLRMATHGFAILAGAMLPVGIGAGIEGVGIQRGVSSGAMMAVYLLLAALVIGSVRLGANPAIGTDAELIEGVFVRKWLRVLLGLGLIALALRLFAKGSLPG